ncbi:MAG TPA: DUF4197 domain-containing protein [Abditibacterium sp.]|jgi:hypothetical protein
MKTKLPLFLALCAAASFSMPAQAQKTPRWLEELLRNLPESTKNLPIPGSSSNNSAPISQDLAVSGLREALSVSTRNAVFQTGKRDGFFRNELIKILMPEKLRPIERGLRAVGGGRQIDEFVLGMNRAAEKAAPQAQNIFLDAIRGMSFSDVYGILRGGDTAATDYFRNRTSARLTSAFRPIVENSMDSVGATRQYKSLVGRYGNLPFVNQKALDIDGYVVNEALDGLFSVVAREERDIRRNPAKRVTQILRDVFGSLGR